MDRLYDTLSKDSDMDQEQHWILDNDDFFAAERRWKHCVHSFGRIVWNTWEQDIDNFTKYTEKHTIWLRG